MLRWEFHMGDPVLLEIENIVKKFYGRVTPNPNIQIVKFILLEVQ